MEPGPPNFDVEISVGFARSFPMSFIFNCCIINGSFAFHWLVIPVLYSPADRLRIISVRATSFDYCGIVDVMAGGNLELFKVGLALSCLVVSFEMTERQGRCLAL